jgi:aconitate hydratase 2/2-methylisocitrate dehydratase
MAATVISPIVDGAYQSGCHTASVWDNKSKANIPRLMKFMNDFGLITAGTQRRISRHDRCYSQSFK